MSCTGCGNKIVKGAIGIAKVVARVDKLTESEIVNRYAECMDCTDNNCGLCNLCKCVIPLKIRVGSESCPKGNW